MNIRNWILSAVLLVCLPGCDLVCGSARGVAARTLAADNVIYNYEWFHLRQGNVQALDVQIREKEGQLNRLQETLGSRSAWSRTDRSDFNQTETELLGLRSQRASIVAEYNAHAGMANRRLFLDGNLPERLE